MSRKKIDTIGCAIWLIMGLVWLFIGHETTGFVCIACSTIYARINEL